MSSEKEEGGEGLPTAAYKLKYDHGSFHAFDIQGEIKDDTVVVEELVRQNEVASAWTSGRHKLYKAIASAEKEETKKRIMNAIDELDEKLLDEVQTE